MDPKGTDDLDRLDDRELVRRFLEGADERAFRALWRRHAPRMHGMLLRMLRGDGRAAEDALQEAWIRAADKLGAFRWESALSTWLTGIAVRCALESGRAAGRRQRLEQQALARGMDHGSGGAAPDLAATQLDPAGKLAMTVDLASALARLPDEGRDVLLLHDVEGYTHGEIAQMLGIEEGTSKSRLWRARRAMRGMLLPGSTADR